MLLRAEPRSDPKAPIGLSEGRRIDACRFALFTDCSRSALMEFANAAYLPPSPLARVPARAWGVSTSKLRPEWTGGENVEVRILEPVSLTRDDVAAKLFVADPPLISILLS